MDRASALASMVLPTPGHVLDEQVALGEQHGQRQPDDLGLALDDLLDRLADPVRCGGEIIELL